MSSSHHISHFKVVRAIESEMQTKAHILKWCNAILRGHLQNIQFKWLSGKCIWQIFRRSWVWISARYWALSRIMSLWHKLVTPLPPPHDIMHIVVPHAKCHSWLTAWWQSVLRGWNWLHETSRQCCLCRSSSTPLPGVPSGLIVRASDLYSEGLT